MARYFDADEIKLICLAKGQAGPWQAARVELHRRFSDGEGGCVREDDDGTLSVVPEPTVRRWRRRVAHGSVFLLVGSTTIAGLIWIVGTISDLFR